MYNKTGAKDNGYYNYTWYPIYQYYVNGEPVVRKSEFGGDEGTFQKDQ